LQRIMRVRPSTAVRLGRALERSSQTPEASIPLLARLPLHSLRSTAASSACHFPSHPPPPRGDPSTHQFHLACKSGALLTAGWPEISPAASLETGTAMAAAAVASSSTPPLRLAQRGALAPHHVSAPPPCTRSRRPRLAVSASAGVEAETSGSGRFYFNFTGFPFPLGPFLNRRTIRTEVTFSSARMPPRLLLAVDDWKGNFLTVSRVGVRRPLGWDE